MVYKGVSMYKKIILGLICFGGSLFAMGHRGDGLEPYGCATVMFRFHTLRQYPFTQNPQVGPAVQEQQPGDEEDPNLEEFEEAQDPSDKDVPSQAS